MAISKELYVANEETVILVGFLIFATIVGKAVVGPYKEWADGQIQVRESGEWMRGEEEGTTTKTRERRESWKGKGVEWKIGFHFGHPVDPSEN